MRQLLLTLAATLLLGGCTINREASLVLAEPGLRVTRAGAEAVGVKISVGDARTDKTSIGTFRRDAIKLNFVAAQPVEAVVAKGVEAELRARGFGLGEGPPYLLVDVERTDSMMNGGPWDVSASCAMTAKVLDGEGRPFYSKTYAQRERGEADDNWAGMESGPVKLAKLLGQAIREMGEDDQLIAALFAVARH